MRLPDITGHQTGYGIDWVTCAVCNKDKPIFEFGERDVPPVCDTCREEYEWLRGDEVTP